MSYEHNEDYGAEWYRKRLERYYLSLVDQAEGQEYVDGLNTLLGVISRAVVSDLEQETTELGAPLAESFESRRATEGCNRKRAA